MIGLKKKWSPVYIQSIIVINCSKVLNISRAGMFITLTMGPLILSLYSPNNYALIKYFMRKSKASVNLKTGRFDNKDLAVIISSVSTAVYNASCTLC